MRRRGVKLFHSEDRGEIMIEERCGMMMMVVVPNKILASRNE